MNPQTYVQEHQKEVLAYLRSRFPVYHLSNVFFRDVQYGLEMMFRERGSKLSYSETEKLARRFVEEAERREIFTAIDGQSWRVNYPEFRKPQAKKPEAKPKPAARPTAAPSAASPRPGGEVAQASSPEETSSQPGSGHEEQQRKLGTQ